MKFNALVPALMLGAALSSPVGALAQENSLFWSQCQVNEVATFSNRVHVSCVSGLHFFASPTSSSAEAARLVALGTAAMMGAGTLWIQYDSAFTDATSYGCDWVNCRRPTEIRLKK